MTALSTEDDAINSELQQSQEDNSPKSDTTNNVFNILHFSDVYDICHDPTDDNKGGAFLLIEVVISCI